MKKIYAEIDIETSKSDKNVSQLKKEISGLIDEVNELNETNQIQKEELLELEQTYRNLPKSALQARKGIEKQMDMLKIAITENNTQLKRFRIEKQQKQKLVNDLKEVQKNFTKNTDAIVGFGHSLSDAAGAMILLSGGSEESTKKLEKGLGVAMAFKSVIHGVKSGVDLFNNVIKTSTTFQKLNNVATTVAAGVMKFFGQSVKTTATSFKVLKGAIVSTGIGALVLLLIEGASALSDWISGTDEAEEAQKKLEEEVTRVNKAIDNQTKAYDKVSRELDRNLRKQKALAEFQGKSTLQLAKMDEEALKERIKLKSKEISDNAKEFRQFRDDLKARGESLLKHAKAEAVFFENDKKLIEERKELRTSLLQLQLKNNKAESDAEKERLKEIQDARDKANAKAQKQRQINQKKKDREAEIQAEKLKRQREKELEEQRQFLLKQIALEDEQFNLLSQLQNTQQEQEIFLLTQEYDKKFQLAADNAELEKALTEQQNIDLKAINDKYRKIEEEEQKEFLQREKAIQEAKLNMASDVFGAIGNLANVFAKDTEKSQKKAFEINKAVGIAQTLIQTFQSAQGAYLSQLSIPTPDAPIRAKIAAGVATAVGLANVAAIAAQKFEYTGSAPTSNSSGGGGGIGDTGATTQPPAFNVVGQSGFNQIATALGQGQPPIQAFVVSQDVTTAQQLDNAIIQTATF